MDVKKFEMYKVKDNVICRGMDGICAVLLQNLFSSNFRCFVATLFLSRFTHFLCGEKLSPKFCPWRKMTDIMYGPIKYISSLFVFLKLNLLQLVKRLRVSCIFLVRVYVWLCSCLFDRSKMA